MENFDFASFSYLDNGTPLDSDLIWRKSMKKKIILSLAIIAILVCLFAISVSAENNIIKLNIPITI